MKKDIGWYLFAILGILVLYGLILEVQHLSGYCHNFGQTIHVSNVTDFWAGGCNVYQNATGKWVYR